MQTQRKKRIEIAFSHRWVIIGATGAGKTFFNRRLLWAYARACEGRLPIFILDTKGYMASQRGRDDFREFYQKGVGTLVRGMNPPDPAAAFRRAVKKQEPFTVWQPAYDDLDVYDQFFQSVYHSGIPQLIDIDELSSITQSVGGPAPRYYNILLQQGRGLDIAMMANTQTPSWLPRGGHVLRQTTHIVRFRLNDEHDSKKLAAIAGSRMEVEPTHDHGFWYRDATKPVAKNPPIYYTDMKEFFGD